MVGTKFRVILLALDLPGALEVERPRLQRVVCPAGLVFITPRSSGINSGWLTLSESPFIVRVDERYGD